MNILKLTNAPYSKNSQSCLSLLPEPFNKLSERHLTLVAFAAFADGDGLGLGFALADDEKIGDFFQFRLSDFPADGFAPFIGHDADTVFLEFSSDLGRIGFGGVGDDE